MQSAGLLDSSGLWLSLRTDPALAAVPMNHMAQLLNSIVSPHNDGFWSLSPKAPAALLADGNSQNV